MLAAYHPPSPRRRTSVDDGATAAAASAESTGKSTQLTVFLVDDHDVVLRALVDLLDAEPDLRVIGEASSVAEALSLVPTVKPDVAVLDTRLPDGNGIELCRALLARSPGLQCVMLTSFVSDSGLVDAILAGASGYVVKNIRGMRLVQAIKEAATGRSLLDSVREALIHQWPAGSIDGSDIAVRQHLSSLVKGFDTGTLDGAFLPMFNGISNP